MVRAGEKVVVREGVHCHSEFITNRYEAENWQTERKVGAGKDGNTYIKGNNLTFILSLSYAPIVTTEFRNAHDFRGHLAPHPSHRPPQL
jgi:hypothetical protein